MVFVLRWMSTNYDFLSIEGVLLSVPPSNRELERKFRVFHDFWRTERIGQIRKSIWHRGIYGTKKASRVTGWNSFGRAIGRCRRWSSCGFSAKRSSPRYQMNFSQSPDWLFSCPKSPCVRGIYNFAKFSVSFKNRKKLWFFASSRVYNVLPEHRGKQ